MASKPSTPIGIVPHAEFVQSIPAANYEGHRTDPRAKVLDEASFKEMQAYLTRYYDGVEVEHSFVDDAGQVFDCVPIHQQPGLKGTNRTLATPPDLSALSGGTRASGSSFSGPFAGGRIDRHGNVMRCPPGTIPIRRITMDQLTRFPTLRDFHSKRGRHLRPLKSAVAGPAASDGHLYAYASHPVPNIGAHTFINLDVPPVAANQVFSLSQHWYFAGSFADTSLQTAEVGWQVYPAFYNHSQPVLFVYWTPDNYNTGTYNLSQDPSTGFQQVNPAWGLGQALPLGPDSTPGGSQYELEVMVYLYQGNWWLYLGGTSASNAIGYWPTSIYNGGAMTTGAIEYRCGGETYSTSGSYPPMGEGGFAAAGYGQAGYHRDIYYFPSNGSAQWGVLQPNAPTPDLYTISISSAPDPWNVYFFYGGPGGAN